MKTKTVFPSLQASHIHPQEEKKDKKKEIELSEDDDDDEFFGDRIAAVMEKN